MALREDKTKADLLRQTLASSADAVEACPDSEALAAYADGALDSEETARYELHFSRCAHCRQQLAAMARAAEPVVAGAPARRFKWVWPWTWFVLVPATTTLLIAVVFFARRPAASHVAEQPLVAMQAPSQPPMDAAVSQSVTADNETPAAPQPEAGKVAPPAKTPATPSARLTRPNAESLQRSAPPDYSVAVQSANEQASVSQAPAEKELRAKSISDLPLNGRNYTNLTVLDKKSGSPASAQPSGSPALTAPAQQPNADAARVGAQSQAVTVESAAESVTTATAVPDRLVTGGAAGGASGVSAGAARSAANSMLHSANQTVMVESAADRDARTLVRSPDPQVLWRISSGRYVERSTDAGATWRAQWTSVNAHVVAGSAPSADTCWLVGNGGIVLVTTDGKKWHMLEPPANADFVSVSASNAASATIASSDGRRFATSDGGKHWNPAP